MEFFSRKDGALLVEEVPLAALAERHGTPAFVYSRAAVAVAWQAWRRAFAARDALICYALKANSNLAVVNLLARLGAGFDVVSGGELERVLAAGGEPGKVVFSGVGKSAAEIRRALAAGVKCFNVESEGELSRLDRLAGEMSVTAPASIRVNPNVDPGTHPYITTGLDANKFGIGYERALDSCRRAAAMDNVDLIGIDCHIGSQVAAVEPYVHAVEKLLALIEQLEESGIAVRHVDIGGGFGIRYRDETALDPACLAAAVTALIPERYAIILEPGRSIVGAAGVLLTRVEYLQTNNARHFAIVDAAMNDLLRPALYQAWHDIVAVDENSRAAGREYDVVGPVCETGDFLGLQRRLAIEPGDLLAVLAVGAYGFSMSSNYNSRPRAVELLVDGDQAHVIRERETIAQLTAGETLAPAD